MQFSYIALNQDRQKLTGVLSAENESEVKKKLHELGLSIISIKVAPEGAEETVDLQEQQKKSIPTFAFHVADKRGNETHGTIDALDRKTAYYRLISEYSFRVISICDASVPEDQQEKKGKEGLDEIRLELEEEHGSLEDSQEDEENEKKSITQTEDFIETKKELVTQVEEVVKQAELVLEKFDSDLSGDEAHMIRAKMDHLMRLRLSNNLKYIQDLADELLTEIDKVFKNKLEEDEKAVWEEAHKDDVEELNDTGAIAHIRGISQRMQAILGGDKKIKKRRIQLKKKKKPSGKGFTRVRLFSRLFRRILWNLKRILTSKNGAVRQRYIKQMMGHFSGFKKIVASPKKKLELIEEEIDEKEEEEEEFALESEEVEEFRKTFFLSLFEESRLFFGWLLGFYIAYFYFAFFVLTKIPVDSSFHSFLYQSITSQFPFLALGIFFLIFLGLTLIIRFTRNNMWYSPIFVVFSAFSILLFLANF